MSVADLIVELRRLDVRLKLDGDRLHVSAPKNALTQAMREKLQSSKPEIIAYLRAAAPLSQEAPPLLKHAAENVAPLTFGQRRLWFLNQLSRGATAYCIPGAIRLKGSLDRAALRRSLDTIIERHAILRTTFHEDEGEVMQVIGEPAPLALDELDLKDVPREERESQILLRITEESQRNFDLETGPLVRGALFELEEEEHVLILNFHHIVADGWSFAIIVRELAALYDAYSGGREAPLDPLPLQYADFAAWQQENLRDEWLDARYGYWRDCLQGELPVLDLPFAHPRLPVLSYTAELESFELGEELSEAVSELSRTARVTPFMTLLAAFKTLLFRYTGEPDVLVGSPIANRQRTELDGMVGFFLNTLVLRTDLSGEPSFLELLDRVRDVTVGAYSNQDMPFEELVAKLNPTRSTSHAPLCQTMFVLQNAPTEPVQLARLDIEPLEVESHSSEYDFDVQMIETASGLRGFLRYNVDLFEPQDIKRFISHYKGLLESAVKDPGCPLSSLSMLGAEERTQIESWNQSRREYDKSLTVVDLFVEQADAAPDALAVSNAGRQLSYGELDAKTNQLAQRLLRMGVSSEEVVGVATERSSEMIVAFLGVLKAGGAYLPLDPTNPDERLKYMIADAGARVVLTDSKHRGRFGEAVEELICLDSHEGLAAESAARPESAPEGRDLAYVVFTSGSTGKPKGVEVEHQALANLVSWHTHTYQIGAVDRLSQLAGMAFDACTWEVWPCLANGASLHIPATEVQSPGEVMAWLAEEAIDVAFMPTPLAEQVLREEAPAKLKLRTLLTGGDKLHRVSSKGHSYALVNHYGPTENAVVSTASPVEPGGEKAPPIGRPIQNVSAYVLDPSMNPVPVGVVGELFLGGSSLARGYRNHPELTAEHFVRHPFSDSADARLYRSGDLVRWLHDGQLEFVGRADSQVKVRGVRIELGEIESALLGYSGIDEAVVLARKDNSSESRLSAYLVCNDTQVPIGSLKSYLRTILPEHMVPSAYIAMDALPRTANGKIDRRSLPTPRRANVADGEFAPPGSDMERLVASIWCDLLNLDTVGVNDNFFDMGGSSLSLMEVEARLRKTHGSPIPLVELFRRPTIAELAAFLSGSARAEDAGFQGVRDRIAKQNAALASGTVRPGQAGKKRNDEKR